MSAPRLVHVAGAGFGSFLDPFDLTLPKSGLVLLRGHNLDTGGSSGSGKSTLINAINYPLGMCDVPTTELSHWGVDGDPAVTAQYLVNGKDVRVGRGKRFSLVIDGETFKGSAAQKEEELRKLFGMDPDMLRALTYRGQRKPGLFLSKTDSEKKEFLTQLLGLDKFEREQDACAAKVRQLESDVAVMVAKKNDLLSRMEQLGPVADRAKLQSDIDSLKQNVAQVEERKRALVERADKAYHDTLLTYKTQIEEAVRRTQRAVTFVDDPEVPPELTRALEFEAETQRRYQRLKSEDDDKRTSITRQRQEIQGSINQLWLKAKKVDRWVADKERLLAELTSLAQNMCPTCQREWKEVEGKRADLQDQLAKVEVEINECNTHQATIAGLQNELEAMPAFQPNPMVAGMLSVYQRASATAATEREKVRSAHALLVAEAEAAHAKAKAEMVDLRSKATTAAQEARQKIMATSNQLDQILSKLRDNLTASTYELGRVIEQERQAGTIQLGLDEVARKLEPLQRALAAERDFAHLIGREGFLGSIFDEVLAEISDETNDILASISNTRHCTLHFASETITQKGSVRREIVPLVTINGHRASLKFGPSGGMLSAIELAVDLAVGAVISRRTGVVPGWLILDESFDGLGPVEKETCLEILQKYAHDRLVLVVDHMTETQGLFTHRINVEFSGGRSRIVVG